ncbi:MAG: trans-aconitate 2-methyltransferase [Solirubrobacteraceae bacterium]|nr:trans-aconitate 2-methyltransferase [Solirubrobacteraceae bacterium]
MTTRDWDAHVYDRVSAPQLEWGREVLERLPLEGDEIVFDAGCGTGRVTAELLERLPRGRVFAVDAAPSMAERARASLDARATVLCQDLVELELPELVDAAVSTATFHWIHDHDRLFSRLHAALRPGGRLVAQFGGRGNIAAFRDALDSVATRAPYARYFDGWRAPWHYPSAEETAERLARAGFDAVECWLEPRPTTPPEPREFLRTVCVAPHLERVPPERHDDFLRRVVEAAGDPLVLDYVRLNLIARRP